MKVLLAILLTVASAQAQTLQEKRWDGAQLRPERVYEVNRIVDRIEANHARYQAVDAATDTPTYVIAALHNMEAGGSFQKHLHEGSPLAGRTRWVPKGRPVNGKPPFKWEDSAIDALRYDRMQLVAWAYLDATLYACERYNGVGYLKYHPTVPTPYLWAGTSMYVRGKYVSDGHWSSTAVSQQIGCAAIWKTMEQRGLIDFAKLKRQ